MASTTERIENMADKTENTHPIQSSHFTPTTTPNNIIASICTAMLEYLA